MNVQTKQFLHTAAFSTVATDLQMLDPVSGSGSTSVNAIKHGRKCILIEQTEAAIELTVKRLEHALEERRKATQTYTNNVEAPADLISAPSVIETASATTNAYQHEPTLTDTNIKHIRVLFSVGKNMSQKGPQKP